MNFITVFCISSAVLCTGAACASLCCLLAGKIFHRRYLKSRFTITCVLFCGVVASVAAVFILIPDYSQILPFSHSDQVFFLAILIIGIACSVLWKIFLPLCVFVYIVVSFVTGVTLYSVFGTPSENHDVTVSSTAILIDGERFSVENSESANIVVAVYTLPNRLLLPLPRIWYRVVGVSDKQFTGGVIDNTDSSQNDMVSNLLVRYRLWLLRKPDYHYVKIPEYIAVPALFILSCPIEHGKFNCVITRAL